MEQIQKRNSIDNNENTTSDNTEQNRTAEQEGDKSRRSSGNSPFKDTKSSTENEGPSEQNKSWPNTDDHNLRQTTVRKSSPSITIPTTSITTNTMVSPQGLSSTDMRNSVEHSGRLMAMLRDNSPAQGSSNSTPASSATVPPSVPAVPVRSDRFSPLSPRDQHMKRPAVNSNPFAHHVEEVKLLDNSLFGRPLVNVLLLIFLNSKNYFVLALRYNRTFSNF